MRELRLRLALFLLRKEVQDMAVVYATLIIKGRKTSPKEGKVIVEGLNMVTKHVKPRRQGEQGGIVKAEGAIYACKVMPVCPKCGKATRVGHSATDG